jgi:cytochrome c biogenesis protein CcmG, thiol:disulfide interchange protein DsbE
MTRLSQGIGYGFLSVAGKRLMPVYSFRFVAVALLLVVWGMAAGDTATDELQLEQYRGKVVVVDFWASWCVPCRRSFPWMNAMQAKYGDRGLVIIGINVDRDRAAAEEFLAEVPADFRIHYDSQADIARDFGVEAMPSSYIIGRDGAIVTRHLGFKVRKQDEYEAILVEALGETP